MNDNLAERFVTSRHRWLIVTAVTLVTALLTVLPQTDELIAARAERAELKEQKEDATKTADMLPLYEQRVGEKEEELATLRRQEVDDEAVAELRSWLVGAAREAGCQVRRIDLATPGRRAWTADDQPLAEAGARPAAKTRTPFDLQTRPVTLSVTGGATEIRALLQTIDGDARAKHANAVEVRPIGRDGTQLQLDLNLWYFALSPTAGKG